MQAHLADLQDMNDLAKALHMHRRSLDRQFTSATGITPWEWLLQRRVAYAERLILETDYTVDYIAELSGLQTPLRFYRAFKKSGKPSRQPSKR